MNLVCRRCGTSVPIPPEATLSPTATVSCPGCGTRYARKTRSVSASTSVESTSRAPSLVTLGPTAVATPPTVASSPAGRPEPPLPGPPTLVVPTRDRELFGPGELVAERYRIRRFIARGGMGEVYEAEDLELGSAVALKTIQPRDADQDLAIERFKREIFLARRVTHPNVCRIYDVGFHRRSDGSRVVFLTMELLHGETLAQRLRRQGRMSTLEALPLAEQMADALGAAHAAGVIHRDFKSENVFLVGGAEGERVVVTDFGVARGLGDVDPFAAHVTVIDAAVGTPAYMAPEQLEGGQLTAAVDQYAFGLVLYEMVTGRLPFSGETPIATAVQRLSQPAPLADTFVPDLDLRWVTALRRSLSKDPSDRFPSVADLRTALGSEPPSANSMPAAATDVPGTPSKRRRRTQLAALAVLSLVLLLAVGHAVFRIRRSLADPLGAYSTVEPRRAVAVLPFENLAARGDGAWLSVALSEMIGSELRAGRGLRTVPADAVARASIDLGIQAGREITPDLLGRLRTRLGADVVARGSFALVGEGDDATIRLAVRLDNARSGEPLGEVVESGAQRRLFDLVASLGSRLRDQFGSERVAGDADLVAAAPHHPRAAQLYAEGLAELRGFNPMEARARFEQAAAFEPSNPLIRFGLGNAWAALGYVPRAEEELAAALAAASLLPPEDRLAAEGLRAELQRDWSGAEEAFGRLWRAFPDSLDYGLKLLQAQLEGGRLDAASTTLAALRQLDEPDRSSPRLDLAEASLALAKGEHSRQRDASARAAARAEELGAPLLVAEAKLREGDALRRMGESSQAEVAARRARELYLEARDRSGEAAALVLEAGALFDRGALADAEAANRRALDLYRNVGDRAGVARALNSLAVLARQSGDAPRARSIYEEVLATLEEIGDRRGSAYARNNLAAVDAEEGRLRAALATAQAALALFRELGDGSGVADALLNLGSVERQLGDTESAEKHLGEAVKAKHELGQRLAEAGALNALGAVSLARGDLEHARELLASAERLASDSESLSVRANALALQSEVSREAGNSTEASERARSALELQQQIGRQSKIDEIVLAMAGLELDGRNPRAALATLARLEVERSAAHAVEFEAKRSLIAAQALAAIGRMREAGNAVKLAIEKGRATEHLALGWKIVGTRAIVELAGGPRDPTLASDLAEARESAERSGLRPLAAELELLSLRRKLRDGDATAASHLEELARRVDQAGWGRIARLARDSSGPTS